MSEPLVILRPGGWLAAAWHPARGRTPVLIVAPPGPDGERSHRALVRLADRLALAGHPVLRLDLSGAGDSGGDLDAMRRTIWSEDAHEGLAELLRRSGAARAVLVGLRLGALVVADAADHPAVVGVVVWEAPADGAAQLADWAAAERARAEPLGLPVREDAVLGHPLGTALRADLAAWRMPKAGPGLRQVQGVGGVFWRQNADAALAPAEALAAVIRAVQELA